LAARTAAFLMSYESSVAQLFELGHELAQTPSHKFDLAHMRTLLGALGNPEQGFRAVLIAGTNGKGSTAAMLESILRAAGNRTGLYTSPHLVRINERIRVAGEQIGEEEFAAAHTRVEAAAEQLLAGGALPWHPSFFEMLTAMAFDHFARSGIEIAVLEVGMGGRLDATNVVEPLLSVITDIALDHQKFLGNSVREIAGEKAGIIRPGGVVVTLPQHQEANDVLGNTILERGARAVNAAGYVAGESHQSSVVSRQAYPLEVMGAQIEVESPLVGRHQRRNVALAIAAAVELAGMGFRITPQAVEKGIRETRWPGRFERIAGQPEMVLDVAHNPAGAWALRAALSQYYEGRRLTLVFGVMRDKAVSEIAEILFPLAERVIATQAANPRSATPQEIREAGARTGAEILCQAEVAAAVEGARQLAGPEGVVVITGSIYVVGEAKVALGE
jgi:dihydrofolate synthase/folylpolyglutamate synthase